MSFRAPLQSLDLALAAAGLPDLMAAGYPDLDAETVSAVLGLGERYFPAMIITVGPLAAGNLGRKPRLSVDELLHINSGF